MTNKEWYLSLPNDLQDKIAYNCNKLNRAYRFAQWYDDESDVSLSGAFCWENTYEGFEFWYAVKQTIK